MMMLSVLRSSGNHKSLFNCFEDFDEWGYDHYVEGHSGESESGIAFFQKKTEYEIVAGYLKVLRQLDTQDLYLGSKVALPLFNGINGNRFCHLIGRFDANLFAGAFNGRNTYHLIGEEAALVAGLQQALTTYLKQTEPPSGTARDLNACLKYFGKTVF